ncbi:STAS domain-containing protein [Flindersiella endophytica]
MDEEHRPWLYSPAPVVQLTDETFVEGMTGLRWQLRAHLSGGARYIIVDVSRVRHLSSTALAALLGAHRICRTRGGAVVLRSPGRRTLDLLTRTGLHQVFRIDRARPEALSAGRLGDRPPSRPAD